MRTLFLPLVLGFCAACTASSPTVARAPAPAEQSEVVYQVVALQNAQAREIANDLRSVLVAQPGRPAPQIVADERTNSLIVACGPDELSEILALVAKLDRPVGATAAGR